MTDRKEPLETLTNYVKEVQHQLIACRISGVAVPYGILVKKLEYALEEIEALQNTRPDNSTDGALELKAPIPARPDIRDDNECDKFFTWALANYDQIRAALQKPEPIEGLGEALEIYASNKVGATVICNKLWQAAKRYQEMSGE